MDIVKESIGMSVLKPLAIERLKNQEKKKRVWSEKMECWGFFADDSFSNEDSFLLYCGINLGDRICVTSSNGSRKICVVVKIWREKIREAPIWKYRILPSDGAYFDLSIKESILFKEAWL
jgi:hypothetical protein